MQINYYERSPRRVESFSGTKSGHFNQVIGCLEAVWFTHWLNIFIIVTLRQPAAFLFNAELAVYMASVDLRPHHSITQMQNWTLLQHVYSPYCSLYIPLGAHKENLFNNQ